MSRRARRRMRSENNTLFRMKRNRKENEMSAQSVVSILNVFYLAQMGLVALAGTSAFVELMITLLRDAPRRHSIQTPFEPEDA